MILERLKTKINRSLFESSIKDIQKTPPIKYRHHENMKIVTQLYHGALNMYLVAIKSFLYNFGSGSVYVLNDGTLTQNDLDVLYYHVPNINIENISNIDVGSCPRGGTWERLIYITEMVKDAYVIQLDSDTISLGPLFEIEHCVSNCMPFIIGNPKWALPVSLEFISDIASNWKTDHVQVLAEMNFKEIAFLKTHKYIRGCSAFVGFPKNSVNKNRVIEFSNQMEDKVGMDKWAEWGSEQVTSNVMISVMHSAYVLPWPRYRNFNFPIAYSSVNDSAALIHYIGSNRFSNREYERNAKKIIQQLIY